MKKCSKCKKRRYSIYFIILLVIISSILYSSFSNIKQIFQNKKDTKKYTEEYNKLVKKEETLNKDLVKLQDPEYVAKYAREKYLYSKDGELIIKIIED